MREIKFRAWNPAIREMLYKVPMFNTADSGYFPKSIYTHDSLVRWDRDKCKLMQFIGLYDKNGKEIYEGDILLHEDGNWGYGGTYDKTHDGYLRTAVPSIDVLLGDTFEYDAYRFTAWEVIGNIYETPELLYD